MRSRRCHRIYFQNTFIWHEKPMCFEKNNMKTSFTHSVGKPASVGSLPSRKQTLRKPLPLCKIAYVSTVNADTRQTVIIHQASISKWTRVFHYVHFHFCIVKNMLMKAKRLVIIPQYARVNVGVTLSTHAHSFTWSRISVGLSSVVFKIWDQRSVNGFSNLRSEVHCMQSVFCSLQCVVCSV